MMKITKITIIFAVLFLTGLSVKAQDCICPEVALENALATIGATDYPYLMNITGFKKYSNVSYKGIDVNSSDLSSYTVTQTGKDVNLYATYDKDGKLIRGIYITKNSRIPKVILDYLVTDSYKGWTMTSNKTIVHDFNTNKTEYEVKIKQGKMKQTLFFDHSGNRINKLSRS